MSVPDDPFGGDPFRGVQNRLNQDVMQTFQRIPAMLEAAVEGKEGPIDVPAEQMQEAYEAVLFLVLRHLPTVAGAVDVANGRIDQLEKRVAALEEAAGRT